MNCPECGAPDSACEACFNECLVKEFEDAAYGVVHHLTVAAYMLQHSSKLTREGWLHERNLLREFLVEDRPTTVSVRSRSNREMESRLSRESYGRRRSWIFEWTTPENIVKM